MYNCVSYVYIHDPVLAQLNRPMTYRHKACPLFILNTIKHDKKACQDNKHHSLSAAPQ